MLTRTGKLIIAGLVVGVVLVVFGVVIDHGPGIIMRKKLPIVNREASLSFPGWTKPTLPIFIKFHFFNVTNVDQILEGQKPVVEEIGPYVYREVRHKDNISFNDGDTEVSYNEFITYVFEPDMSKGTESDMVSNYNIPYVTIIEKLDRSTDEKAPKAKKLMNAKARAYRINLFTYVTVRGLLFGHTNKFLSKIINNSLFKGKIKTDQFGFLLGKNGTAGPDLTIGTGINAILDIAQVKRYEGNATLDFWYSDEANAIKGTDGSMFHPGVTKDEKLDMFSPDLCRSVQAEFIGEEMVHGVKTFVFQPSKSVFAAPKDNPANAAFCFPTGKAEDCMGQGLLRVTACKKGAPMVASSPHLLGAEPKYLAKVDGLKPNKDLHVTKLNIEPNSGLLLGAKKRIQYNVHLNPMSGQTMFKKAPEDIVLPLLWIEQGFDAPEEFAAKLSKLPAMITMCHNLMLVFVALGALLIVACVIAAFVYHERIAQPEMEMKAVPTRSPDDNFQNANYTKN